MIYLKTDSGGIVVGHDEGGVDRASSRTLLGNENRLDGEMDRSLGSSSSSYATLQIDYSVLAVLVMTLGLILVVEVARHRLDYAAKNRPFFKNVLDGVYTECTYMAP
jgi:hypothetical protein